MIFYVNGCKWAVVFVNEDDPHLWTGKGYTLGVTDLRNHIVYISRGLDNRKLFNVLKHECCHVFMYSYKYELDIPEEECLCQTIEAYGDDIHDLANNIYKRI